MLRSTLKTAIGLYEELVDEFIIQVGGESDESDDLDQSDNSDDN